ncbi:MAG: GGDEF domain-containing protein, partial [Nocardioides sp.]
MDALPGTWPALALLLLGLLVVGVALGLLAVAGLRRLRRSGDMVITFRPEDPRSRRRTPRLRRLAPEESQRDGLTGLRTRSVLPDDGATLLAEATAQGRRVGLLLFDLDGFKGINDTLGHHSGDRVLAEVGRRTQELVGGDDVAVRLGGDEFAL